MLPRLKNPVLVISASLLAMGALVSFPSSFAATDAGSSLYLVRLTPSQYERSILDVFGSSIQVTKNTVGTGFRDEGLLAIGSRRIAMTSAEMQQYEQLAQAISTQVVDLRRRDTLLGCKPRSETAPDVPCASAFFEKAGLFLFRRPLSKAELDLFVATHAEVAKKLGSFNAGMSAALTQMLVAPEFLFRLETTEPDPAHAGMQRLDAYSAASRLSYLLWDSSPDALLLTSAKSGQLQTTEGLQQQVDRMLMSPRIENGIRAFFTDMFGFDEFATLAVDSTLYPRFTKNVLEDADEQTLRTIVDQLLVRNKAYGELFVTRQTFLTPALAAAYGVALPRKEEMGGAVPWVPFEYPEGDAHVGLLGQVSFLSLNSHPGTSSPTLRGKALREKLLCQKVPAPPANVDFSLVQDLNNPVYKTARQRLSAHATEATCAACHKITDPMGFALENFDTAGGFRKTERGEPIDATGSLNGRDFNGIQELAKVLKDTPAVSSCLINRTFSYGTQRQPSRDERAWLTGLQRELLTGGIHWRDLLRRITLHPNFYSVPDTAPVVAANVAGPAAASK